MESNYIRFTALSGSKSEAALCYLLEIDEAKIMLDCGWNDAFDVDDLRQLKRYMNCSHSGDLCSAFYLLL